MKAHADRETLIAELGKLAYREHCNCEEDPWYGCPLSRDGCSNDAAEKGCTCGAEQHNARVAELLKQIGQQRPKGKSRTPICPGCLMPAHRCKCSEP